MSTPDRYALFGQPVGHSLSPRIHALFASATHQQLSYEAVEVAPAELAATVRRFFEAGGRGLNITVPHKSSAFALCTELSARARLAGAVNTLMLTPGSGALAGDNTDGVGLIRDLTVNLEATVRARRVLVLGAGGATRGIVTPLLEQSPTTLCVANRTRERAAALAAAFAGIGAVRAAGFEELAGTTWDLVLNATSASLADEVPDLDPRLLAPGCLCYDLAYGHHPTAFMRWGAAHGAARTASGLGMLIEQAAEAFFLWRGVRPDTAPVRAQLLHGDTLR